MPEQRNNFKLLIINYEMLNTSKIQPNFCMWDKRNSRPIPKNVTRGQIKSQIGVPGEEFEVGTISREDLRAFMSRPFKRSGNYMYQLL